MSNTSGAETVGSTLNDLKAVGDAAQQVGQQATNAGSDALAKAKDVVQDASDRASSVASSIGERASSVAEEQKSNLADKLDDVAKAVHRSGAQLEGHQDWAAHLVERGAAELSVLATTLRTNDLQGLLGDLGSLARRQPALFIGASMAAGFALARVGRVAATTSSPPSPPAAAPGFPPLVQSAATPQSVPVVVSPAAEVSHER